jgi:YHS domain-containing protein
MLINLHHIRFIRPFCGINISLTTSDVCVLSNNPDKSCPLKLSKKKLEIKCLKEVEKMAIDPICKMAVDEKTAEFISEYKGTKYYFCAPGCKNAFDENPEKYL